MPLVQAATTTASAFTERTGKELQRRRHRALEQVDSNPHENEQVSANQLQADLGDPMQAAQPNILQAVDPTQLHQNQAQA